MNRLLQLASAFLLAAILVPAHGFAARAPKPEKPQPENVEWLWQYTPDEVNKDGRENELVQDLRFRPFLEQFLTAPQTFWGQPVNGKYPSLAETALVHLTVPGKVIADDNRYVSVSGAVLHFAPARGLLWVDLNGKQHLVVFAAINWTQQGHSVSDPAAEYTLWVFPDEPLAPAVPSSAPPGKSGPERIPPALTKAIGRWTAEPLAGSGIVQNISHAVLVDPDGTQHEVPPAALGVQPPPAPKATTTSAPGAQQTPATNSEPSSAPVLKPRN